MAIAAMKLAPEIQEFFVEGNDQEQSHVLLHIAEPATPEEEARGYFFALIEINNAYGEQVVHMQRIIDDIETKYYSIEGGSIESILEEVNLQSHHLLEYRGSVINCLVGVLHDGTLALSFHGTPRAFLLYSKEKNENGELKEIDIIDDDGGHESRQLFSALIEGKINPGDYLYLGTPHVEEHFTIDRVKKLVTGRPIRHVAQHIQKVLTDLKGDFSFGGVFFHIPAPTGGLHRRTIEGQGSQESMERLLTATQKTEETLSPPLFGNMRKRITKGLRDMRREERIRHADEGRAERRVPLQGRHPGAVETNFRPPSRESTQKWWSVALVLFGRGLVATGTGILFVLKKLIQALGKGLVILFYLITNKRNKRTEYIELASMKINDWKTYIERLPLVSKILFIATIMLGAIFIGSIVYLKAKEGREARAVEYDHLAQGVIDKKDAAEARLIYGEDAAALTLLQEAEGLLAQLPQSNKKQKTTAKELKESVQNLLLKLRKITVVSPEVIADIGSAESKAKTTGLVQIADQLVAFGSEDEWLYLVNAATHKIEVKPQGAISKLAYANVPKEQDKIVFVTANNTIAEYDLQKGSLAPQSIVYPNENVQIRTLFVYNRKLYVLDAGNGFIYKHSPTQTGYDKGALWIQDRSFTIKEGISMAIDGDMFVLKNTGEVVKLVGGVPQAFTISGVEPALQHPTMLWTYNNVNNLYILEPEAKRIVVTDKNGKFVGQYTYPEWKNPVSMVVNEEKKTIFVLDDNKIYKFGM